MFKDDDDREEDNTFGVTRYPCMPSLVALQQMRNRLHLANLGKKLMKWTALATSAELRNDAERLDKIYQSFSEDMRNAYILLARCRYFYPNLNKMVIEGCPKVAEISLLASTKTAAGVKIIKYDIIKNKTYPYAHLGIEKGGQTILDTKKAWRELLKRIIIMVELRTNFTLVENMHKAANKKINVLGKVVIPKTKATCAYIISALEELARDEFYRRKMILEVKKKQKRKGKEPSSDNLVLKSDNMDRASLLHSLKDNISEILEKVNTIDEKTAEESDIKEFLAIGEELKTKLDASLIDSECCSDLVCTRSDLESETNKTAVTVKPNEKILPLENYYTPEISNFGTFEIVVKEVTKIERTINKDGTIKEEKKIVKVRKVFKGAESQNLISTCTSYSSSGSKDDTISSITSRETSGSSKSSKKPKTTIQMLSVNDWVNNKFSNKSSLDQKFWAEEIYGETSKFSARMYYDNLFFRRYFDPTLDEKYLKYRDFSSPESVSEDEDSDMNKMQDSHISLSYIMEECVKNNVVNSIHLLTLTTNNTNDNIFIPLDDDDTQKNSQSLEINNKSENQHKRNTTNQSPQ